MRYQHLPFITAIASSAMLALILTSGTLSDTEIEPTKFQYSKGDTTIAGETEESGPSIVPRQTRKQVSNRKASIHPRRSGPTGARKDMQHTSFYPIDFDNPQNELWMSQDSSEGGIIEYGDPLDANSILQHITSSFVVEEIGPPLDPDSEPSLEGSDQIKPQYIGEPMDADSTELTNSNDKESDYEINIGEYIDLDSLI